MTKASPLPIRLALQGGGSHGALAWGVLDRLLEEDGFAIEEISGTSAGAMNAAILAAAYETGGPEAAREALAAFWSSISEAARFSPLQPSPWHSFLGLHSLDASPAYLMLDGLSRMFSPYELNPMDINPLRDLLERQIDFEALNRCQRIRIHVTATSVRTGLARVFSTGELSAEALLASACLPQMFRAVEIGGDAYWDGGFSANPALGPLVRFGQDCDLLIVQLNPMLRDSVPRTAREIINRTNEISFNTTLIKELRTLDLLQRLEASGKVELPGDIRLHMIHCGADLELLSASSKMNAEWGYLSQLFARGRIWAEDWLARHRDSVGRHSSFALDSLFAPPAPPATLKPIRRAGAAARSKPKPKPGKA